jgi:CBS domain-containing membrane protein
VHSAGYHFVLTPVLLNSRCWRCWQSSSTTWSGAAIRIRWRQKRSNPSGAAGDPVTREDIHAALLDGQFLDIDEDDVQELLENIEQKARMRMAAAPKA